jgi:pyruvate dehydrogenase E1 component alpha subunit
VREPDGALVQLLTPDGELVDSAHTDTYRDRVARFVGPDADPDALRGLYRDMVLVRRFDEEATSLQRQGELGLFAPLLGQEAAQIGSGRALAPGDFVFPSYREHGVAWTRGMDPSVLLQMFRGVDHGGWDPTAHNFHTYTLVIASHALHATGYAMAMQRDGRVGSSDPSRDAAVVAYFGDGATSQGDASEALGFAAVNNAPVVFFVQNNQWAISAPTTTQSRVPIYQRAWGFGVPSIQVDGNDVLASYAVTQEALERARSGGGPTFIEAVTYRMGAHTTSDDPSRYRTSAQDAVWLERDPLARVRTLLDARGWWDDARQTELDTEADALGEHVRTYTRGLDAPPTGRIFDDVYATEHAQVTAERAWFEEYEAALVPAGTEGGAR